MIHAADIEVKPDELLVMVGPTASGKSALAMDLAVRLGGEIIGADSVQIYRFFDLGSGKPDAADMQNVRHHVVDAIDPMDHFDAAHFVERADQAITDIRSRGRVPIVCGGTFLWIKALLFGLAEMPRGDEKVRARHEEIARQEGRPALHAQLHEIDPQAAKRLAPNDLVRVSRALEVFELTGKTLTDWHAEHRFQHPRHQARLYGVERGREALDTRIRQRTQHWLATGWRDEVIYLCDQGYRHARAMHAVGYRQVVEHIEGQLPESELEDAIVRATRQFARRQRTWLRDQPVTWLAPIDEAATRADIANSEFEP